MERWPRKLRHTSSTFGSAPPIEAASSTALIASQSVTKEYFFAVRLPDGVLIGTMGVIDHPDWSIEKCQWKLGSRSEEWPPHNLMVEDHGERKLEDQLVRGGRHLDRVVSGILAAGREHAPQIAGCGDRHEVGGLHIRDI
jgi:hypothetical protein